jgi:plasmid stability protein
MKNITLSIDDEAYRNARVWAALHNTSVSAVVRDLLNRLRGTRRTTPTPMPPDARAPYQRKICQACPLAKMQVNPPRGTTLPPPPFPVKL